MVVSGHDEEMFANAVAGIDAGETTLVVLMGVARSASLARQLIGRGWPARMPAALIVGGSLSKQQVWRGRLDELAEGRATIGGSMHAAPGTIVIGEVVSVSWEALCQPSTNKPPTAARG
jgi:siroheme synthase